jgi:Fe-S cluster assembly ATP-binding protein
MLEINQLRVAVGNKEIIKNISLNFLPGEIHVLMGQNGSGKSTLASALAGHPDYHIKSGEVNLNNKSLINLSPDDRAKAGLFLSFQAPISIPGLKLSSFLRLATNELRRSQKKSLLSVLEFNDQLKILMDQLDLPNELIHRGLNEGFSGGERKQIEILQLAILDQPYVILDECDSGLDIDATKRIGKMLESLANKNRCLIIITHSSQLFKWINPTHVHIISQGRIILSGNQDIIKKIERNGYRVLREIKDKSI